MVFTGQDTSALGGNACLPDERDDAYANRQDPQQAGCNRKPIALTNLRSR